MLQKNHCHDTRQVRLPKKIGFRLIIIVHKRTELWIYKGATESRTHSKPKGSEYRKLSLESGRRRRQAWIKLLQLCFRKLLVKTASHWKLTNSICKFSGPSQCLPLKRTQRTKILIPKFSSPGVVRRSLLEAKKKNNGLGITLNVLRINSVERFQLWEVNNVRLF
jgi:hypothetical protein